jgi:hypothetical protein
MYFWNAKTQQVHCCSDDRSARYSPWSVRHYAECSTVEVVVQLPDHSKARRASPATINGRT